MQNADPSEDGTSIDAGRKITTKFAVLLVNQNNYVCKRLGNEYVVIIAKECKRGNIKLKLLTS